MTISDLGRTRMAIVDSDHCHFPVAAEGGLRPTAELRLPGARDPVLFTRVTEAPFGAAYAQRWRSATRRLVAQQNEEAALHTSYWLATKVIAEWKRSQEEGLPYSDTTELPCPTLPVAAAAEPPCPLAGCNLPDLPLLVWFTWVYILQADPRGTVRLYDRRYNPLPLRPLREWAHAFDMEVERAVLQATASVHVPLSCVQEELGPELEGFRERARDGAVVTLHQDDILRVYWDGPHATMNLSMKYGAFWLEGADGTIYEFSPGRLEFATPPDYLSVFMQSPRESFPCAFVRPGRTVELHPFVREADHALCEDGHFAANIGDSQRCGLAPPGKLLRALKDGIRILQTGGGNVAYTPYRALERSNALVIDRATAQQRNLPVIRWRHEERGREAVRLA